ncbi:uncharacterized protein LODBEIA_P56170 [Lodderomyces beijingensis]|uniref:Ribosomal protein L19 n=1 Tax=Lodderomyces beijingensis TaxID=1775926 RepID=A0ABP0ZTD6_9ASCO
MFTSISRPLRPISHIVQSMRTFRYLKKPLPTVYEPLPRKLVGVSAMKYVQDHMLQKHDPTGRRRELLSSSSKGLRAGDIVKVTYMDRTDVTGRIIAIKRGRMNLGSSLLLRTKINKVGSEIRVPVYNPNIRLIERVYKPEKYMRARAHYFIRGTKFDVGDVEAFARRQALLAKEKKAAAAEAKASGANEGETEKSRGGAGAGAKFNSKNNTRKRARK